MDKNLEKNSRVWKELVKIAKARKTIQYNHLAELSKLVKDRSEYRAGQRPSKPLRKIQEFCSENKLPPLTVIAHNWKGKRGKGYIPSPDLTIEEEVYSVWEIDWSQVGNPFSEGRGSLQKKVEVVKNGSDRNKRKYAQRPYREQQPAFRKGLLDYYRKCAFCNVSIKAILDAAHIKPWSACENVLEKIDLNNGLLLCKNHHYAFDAGLLWVANDLTICSAKSDIRNEIEYQEKIKKPEEVSLSALQTYLAYHRKHKPKL